MSTDYVDTEITIAICHENTVLMQIKDAMKTVPNFHLKVRDYPAPGLATLCFTGVPNGDFGLQDNFKAQGIANHINWSAGEDLEGGDNYCHFNENGECRQIEVLDSERSFNVEHLHEMLCKDGPEATLEHINKVHAEQQPWPWINQEDYGKRYMARELIAFTEDPKHTLF